MPVSVNIIGLVAGALLVGFGRWRETRQQLGVVPFIAPVYVQLFGLIISLVFAANLVAEMSGISWTPPFRR